MSEAASLVEVERGSDVPWLTPYERHLDEWVKRLRGEVSAINTRPIWNVDSPGHEVWRALMEDARERGEVRLSVRTETYMTVEWEPTAKGRGSDDA
jgi:hypothetical protein